MQIDRGGMLQRFVLSARDIDHVRMAMPDADRHDATKAVEVAAGRVSSQTYCIFPSTSMSGFL